MYVKIGYMYNRRVNRKMIVGVSGWVCVVDVFVYICRCLVSIRIVKVVVGFLWFLEDV